MKARVYITILMVLVLVLISFLKNSWSQQLTSTGFYYPTGTIIDPYPSSGWLSQGCNGNSDYLPGEYHLGIDISANVGNNVFAVSDGIVVNKSYSDWGDGNIALVIKHNLSNEMEFLALYGHIQSDLYQGDSVTAGQVFATIGPWYRGAHLHFGINLRDSIPVTNWGKMSCSEWPDTNGFVEPIIWIKTQKPIDDPLDLQAKQDMEKRALEDLVYVSLIIGTFGKNLNWDINWELRWMDFNYLGHVVRIFHATYKSSSSVRYTGFYDPNTAEWTGWKYVQ